MLGGIFDSPVKYLYDAENGIDLIGNWQIINQLNAELALTKTSEGHLLFKNTTDSLGYSFGCYRNEIPISIKGYAYVYIHFVESYYYSTSSDGADHANKIRIYRDPDLSNDEYIDKAAMAADEAGFFNGTYVSGTVNEYLGRHKDFTVEMDISKFTGTSSNFRMIGTIGPCYSYMQIDKIYISRYKLT